MGRGVIGIERNGGAILSERAAPVILGHPSLCKTLVGLRHAGSKDKSQAINMMAKQFEECILEPELRPEFVESLKASETEKTIKVSDFAKRYSK